jgi:demethylmenaquinone methyltransferase/2-methoxy-6-polyprenyl-1,4-benzoquinol methylase
MASSDHGATLARYRTHAAGYDASARRTMRLRRRTIARLHLAPGDAVLDVACGTGLSLPLLQEDIGAGGRLLGVEISPEMLGVARRQVAEAGWRNVTLIEAPMENAAIPFALDAVLFNFTHDVLRSPAALANIFASAKPGARVAVAGMKFAPWWLAPLNVVARAKARPYMRSFEGLREPWSLLAPHLDRFAWRHALFGIGYIGWGRVRGA